MCYIDDQHIIDLSCSGKTLGSFKKYVHSKLLVFDSLPPCSSLFILHVTPSKGTDIKKKYKEEMEGVHDNAIALMHLNIKTNS